MNQKECNRKEFYKQYLHEKELSKNALGELDIEDLEILAIDEIDLKKCTCDNKSSHLKYCSEGYKRMKEQQTRRYVFFKTKYNHMRLFSPDYEFRRIVLKNAQFKVDSNKLKEAILKRKQYKDDYFY